MTSRQGQLSLLFFNCADFALQIFSLALAIVIANAGAEGMGMSEYSVDFFSTRIQLGNAVLCGMLLFIWHICFRFSGLYLSNRLSTAKELCFRIVRAVAASSIALLIFAQFAGWKTVDIYTIVCFTVINVSLITSLRLGVYYSSRRFRQRGINTKSLLIIGGGARSENLIQTISGESELGYKVLGYLDSSPAFSRRKIAESPWLGRFEDLTRIINEEVVDEAAIALPIKSHYKEIKIAIAQLEEQGVVVHLLSDFFPYQLSRIQSHEFKGLPLLSLHSSPRFSWRVELKRLFDIVLSAGLLILLAPLFLLIAILIKLDSPGPCCFYQERMGYNKRRFFIIKFRTMVTDAEVRLNEIQHLNEKNGPIFKIKNDPRITRIGKYLRKFSLDELPQLINILLGDMSLVGPRPLALREALKLEEPFYKRRFCVRPGLTCLWQISGRSNLSFEEWMELDLKYIDHWSLHLDWWILAKTVPAVLTARGAV
ncbi:MAG: sugar transferase [Pyrinomonadaceae bacterium]|nr:sugar transferase [Pyrinomonadaceae bacterium]